MFRRIAHWRIVYWLVAMFALGEAWAATSTGATSSTACSAVRQEVEQHLNAFMPRAASRCEADSDCVLFAIEKLAAPNGSLTPGGLCTSSCPEAMTHAQAAEWDTFLHTDVRLQDLCRKTLELQCAVVLPGCAPVIASCKENRCVVTFPQAPTPVPTPATTALSFAGHYTGDELITVSTQDEPRQVSGHATLTLSESGTRLQGNYLSQSGLSYLFYGNLAGPNRVVFNGNATFFGCTFTMQGELTLVSQSSLTGIATGEAVADPSPACADRGTVITQTFTMTPAETTLQTLRTLPGSLQTRVARRHSQVGTSTGRVAGPRTATQPAPMARLRQPTSDQPPSF